VGRGGVDYEYSIGRFEVTTAQWVEFLNAALDRPAGEAIPFVSVPGTGFWGGTATTPMNPGGRRFVSRPGQEMFPVGDIDWRMSAVLCNWYHNGKSLDRSAFLNGAYDASTFGYGPLGFTDQMAHHPDARYWIPTWDEWLKAAHFDPHKNGPDQPGWWVYSYRSDTQLLGGPPGTGVANFGFTSGAFSIPLGAYPQTMSPWGLLDVAGATSEWTEHVLDFGPGEMYRTYVGSAWRSDQFSGIADAIFAPTSELPHIAGFTNGLRIASAVPAPSTAILAMGVYPLIGWTVRRRRR
ncbi:MAG: SUMF1/EgtB/PvdO family nonheme iron enzyme, partial [Phycisphaerales bacterium]